MTLNRTFLQMTKPVLLLLVIAIAFFSFSYRLGEVPPYHTDEDFYVQSAKTMLETGDYLTPVYHDEKRFAKPIFFYWLVALSYKIFGVNLISARLCSVFFATLSVGLTFLVGRRLFDSGIALMGAAILPSLYLHFQISRWATTDMTLSFFILLAFYFFIRAYQQESGRELNYCFFYLAMALGFLTKGPPAILIPALTIFPFLLIRREWRTFAQMRLLTGCLILLIVDVPWFAMMLKLHGDEFSSHILGAEVRDRVLHSTPFSFYYFGVLVRYFLPWSPFLLLAFAVYAGLAQFAPANARGFRACVSAVPGNLKNRVLRLVNKEPNPLLFCLLWIFIPLLIFTLVRIEHSRYMLPAAPAVALVLGHFFSRLAGTPLGFRRPLFKVPFFLAVVLFFLLTAVGTVGVLLFTSFTSVPFRIMFFPFFLATGTSVLIVMFLLKQRKSLIVGLALVQILSLTMIHGDMIPFFNQYPMKKFAVEISKSGTGDERIGVYHMGSHQARMGVLTGQFSKFIFTPEQLQEFLDTDQKVFVVMRKSVWENTFNHLPLSLLAEDKIWKKQRVDKTYLKELWNRKLDIDSTDLFETVYLFTKG